MPAPHGQNGQQLLQVRMPPDFVPEQPSDPALQRDEFGWNVLNTDPGEQTN
jgi:hypothetical protein